MNGYLTLAIHELVWRMDAAADGILQGRLGIDFQVGRVLMTLRSEQPCSQRNLATCLGITPPAITRSLPTFLNAGWVRVEVDPRQPRRNLLTLTEEGMRLADACWQILESEFAALLADAGVDGDAFQRQLEAINATLDHGDKATWKSSPTA